MTGADLYYERWWWQRRAGEMAHLARLAESLIRNLRMYSAQKRLHDLKRGGWGRTDWPHPTDSHRRSG